MKKAIGAERKTLVFQYLSESLLMAFISLAVAILLVLLFLSQFNQITGKELSLNANGTLIGSTVGVALVTGLLAGSYPALYLSGLDAVTMLRGRTFGNFSNSIGETVCQKGFGCVSVCPFGTIDCIGANRVPADSVYTD